MHKLDSPDDDDFLRAVLYEAIMEEDCFELCLCWCWLHDSHKPLTSYTLQDKENLKKAVKVFVSADIQGGKYNQRALSFVRLIFYSDDSESLQ